jgi:hypothetical protein
MNGHRVWFFPDGELPDPGDAAPHGHESLIVLNPGALDAAIRLTVFYPDREPDTLTDQLVAARRVRCIRMDEPIDGFRLGKGQYALKLESTQPVVCQIGRMDVSQPNLAYYTVMGHPA